MEKTDKETAMVFYEIKADYTLTPENVDEEANPLYSSRGNRQWIGAISDINDTIGSVYDDTVFTITGSSPGSLTVIVSDRTGMTYNDVSHFVCRTLKGASEYIGSVAVQHIREICADMAGREFDRGRIKSFLSCSSMDCDLHIDYFSNHTFKVSEECIVSSGLTLNDALAKAEEIAKNLPADIFEINPVKPYTTADINWMNPFARCNREKIGGKDVSVRDEIKDFGAYDTLFIGFPIWYGVAPNVVNTFCKAYNWRGKKVHIFATSGGSAMGNTAEKLAPYLVGAEIVEEKLISSYDVLEKCVSNIKKA